MAFDGKREKTKSLVEAAVGILQYDDGMVQKGRLKTEDAPKQAMKELEALRFGESNYFFIVGFNHMFVMHPFRKDLVGKENRELQDAKGGYFRQDIVKVGA
jgi:methyl-accepting chemotaxis protein